MEAQNGLFVPQAREQIEMQYQGVTGDYIFDDSKFMQTFPAFQKTAWPEIIDQTLTFFKNSNKASKKRPMAV